MNDSQLPTRAAKLSATESATLHQVNLRNAPPRTDVGTLVLHWATAITFTVSLFTGLRIASDGQYAIVCGWGYSTTPKLDTLAIPGRYGLS
jgi:hypothetical protein